VPKRDDARWLSAALDLFEKNELRAPRPVYRDVSLFSRWRWGWSVFVEEFVEGKALEESAAAAALEGLGRAYAAVHAVQSPTWDRPHRPRGGEMIAESVGWLEKISRRAARDAPPDIASGFERGLAAIREERPGEPISYSLCHKRVTPANVIVKPDGTCVLIDLERVKFGSHLEELARIRLDVLGGSSERFRSFLDGYGEESSPDRVPDLEGPEWRWHLRFLELKRAEEAAAARDYPACRRWLEVKSG
jgi:Ser/Thr protein kinase RdoA (MazF antagonist)